jgi:TRAP-type uncharacterized transport system substrate-binding protein
MFPRGSKFLRINTNDKAEAQVLDQLLDGSIDSMIPINGAPVPASALQITHLTFAGNIAFVVISPKGAADVRIPMEN